MSLQHFGQHKTTLVVTRHVSWAQNITKIALRPGLCSEPRWKSSHWSRFAGGEGRKGKTAGREER